LKAARWYLAGFGTAVVLALGLGTCPARPAPPAYTVRAVIDGDTIEIVDAGGIRTRVRFQDVDAPELDEPGGPEARDALHLQPAGCGSFAHGAVAGRRLPAQVARDCQGISHCACLCL